MKRRLGRLADEYSEKTADKYSEMRSDIASHEKPTHEILRTIGIRNKTILDFGCGDGVYSKRFAEKGAKNVIGIDNSRAMIKLANAKHSDPKIKYFKQDGAKLSLPKNSFDFVFASFVLQNFKDSTIPLKQIYKVLKKEGYLVAIIPVALLKPQSENLVNTIIKIHLAKKILISNYIKTDEELQSNIKKAGFSIKEIRYEKNPDAEVDSTFLNKDKIKSYDANIYVAQKL